MAHRLVCVFGGSGFIGRHLVRRLAAAGERVRIAVRDPEGAHFLKPSGDVGQIHAVKANLRSDAQVRAAVQGADVVVNLVGTLVSRSKQSFIALHAEGPARLAAACRDAGVETLVHLSSIGADPKSRSAYARTKAAGEEGARQAFPNTVLLRPSVVFGPEDDFFNRFAALSSISPFLPVIGSSHFQPVYVGDVADAIMAVLKSPAHAGKTYSLGGPRTYTMREILELTLSAASRDRALINLPPAIASIQAFFLQFLPNPPLTPDQVRQLAVDNVVPAGAPGLAELGVTPTAAEAIVPTYLARFHNPFAPRRASGAVH